MAKLFNLEIITPQGLFLQEEVESLTIKLSSGYRTFLAKHLPLIGAIEYDEMHIMKNNNYICQKIRESLLSLFIIKRNPYEN